MTLPPDFCPALQKQRTEFDRLWLFLDYDGTLADFAPTPNIVSPDPDLVALLDQLARLPHLRLTVISGRPLALLRSLLPLSAGILMAGSYGLEIQTAAGARLDRLSLDQIRSPLEELKPLWETLIANHNGYYLEDKGWTIALHARYAPDEEAEIILASAHGLIPPSIRNGQYRILTGHKFLEVGPAAAHKGLTVDYLLEWEPWPHAGLIYAGDDIRDEEAFGHVQVHKGLTILVAPEERPTLAQCRLPNPAALRAWLRTFLSK